MPIFDADLLEEVPPAFAVTTREGGAVPWTRQLTSVGRPLLMVQLVQSAYAGRDGPEIGSYLPGPVDADTLARVDEAICQRLYGESVAAVRARHA